MTDRLVLWSFVFVIFIFAAPGLWPCNVPVFRYALERWPAGSYEAIVGYDRPFSAEQSKAADFLAANSKNETAGWNLTVKKFDLQDDSHANLKKWFGDRSLEPPRILLRYPPALRIPGVIESGALDEAYARSLVDSPVRRQIVSRLLGGETAVWLFLESGDAAKDEILFTQVTQWLDEFERTLKLPDLSDVEDADTVALDSSAPALAIQFSPLRISRNDLAESALVNILLHSEPDLLQYENTAMLFPIFGRGRILYGLIGEGINRQTVQEAAEFVIGPCSCLIKDINPGVDLLLPVNWDENLQEFLVQDRLSPPPFGLAQIADATAVAKEPAAISPVDSSTGTTSGLTWNLIMGIGFITLVNVLFLIKILRKSSV